MKINIYQENSNRSKIINNPFIFTREDNSGGDSHVPEEEGRTIHGVLLKSVEGSDEQHVCVLNYYYRLIN
jgi:hypothetical protein